MGNEISVILNVYKRPHTLGKQINALRNQSVPVKAENIHIWYNYAGMAQPYPSIPQIKTYVCNWNTKFYGRFTVPLMIQTPYVAMFDDDLVPQKDWFRNCLDTIENPATNGILGGSGVIIHEKSYVPCHKIGWNEGHLDHTERVDLVGHAWFFRQEWAKYLWYEKPITYDNGEDIWFSYLAQKYGNINTFVPPHPVNNTDLWSTEFDAAAEYGMDDNANWRLSNHRQLRDKICAYCIDNGWKTVNNIQK